MLVGGTHCEDCVLQLRSIIDWWNDCGVRFKWTISEIVGSEYLPPQPANHPPAKWPVFFATSPRRGKLRIFLTPCLWFRYNNTPILRDVTSVWSSLIRRRKLSIVCLPSSPDAPIRQMKEMFCLSRPQLVPKCLNNLRSNPLCLRTWFKIIGLSCGEVL